MLTFRRLKAQNFCQHRSLDIELSPGVVGIVGPNGSGKSNLIKALFRALTGKSLNPGKKEEDVFWGAESGSLELEFSINGTAATIARDLKTERCSLVIGTEKLRKAKEIEVKLYPFLGVSPRVLADVVFVMQGKIEGMLFQTPADRMASFQHLYGTHNAERIRDLLHDELTNIVADSREEQIKSFRAKLDTEVEPPLKEAVATIESLNALQISTERRGEIEKMIDRRRRAEFSIARMQEIQPLFDKADADVTKTEKEIKRQAGIVLATGGLLEELKPEVEKARLVLRVHESHASMQEQRQRLETELQTAKDTLQKPEPTCEVTADDVDKASQQYAQLAGEYAQYRKISSLALPDAATCPTCGQAIDEGHIVEAKMKADRMEKGLGELRQTVQAATEELGQYRRNKAVWTERISSARGRVAEMEMAIGRLPQLATAAPEELAEAKEVVAKYDEVSLGYQEMRNKLAVLQATLKVLQSARLERERELEGLKTEVAKDPGVAAVQGVKDILEQDTKARQDSARASGVRDSLMKQKADLESQIAQWEAEEVKLARIRIWKGHLENGRRLLHRDALPGEVARTYMEALNERLSYYLELFGSPFAAEISADALVTCRFTGLPEMPSERLSGGQKVILGVAFRFAIYDLFVADLGVMILDEPTVYLDNGNVGAVAELLNHLKGFSRQAGMQLIVVTHEQQLVDSFDQVISLSS
jgi:exonuclease SbcC